MVLYLFIASFLPSGKKLKMRGKLWKRKRKRRGRQQRSKSKEQPTITKRKGR